MLRVMLDTNILFSALFYPSTATRHFFNVLLANHRIVLCNYVSDELRRITCEKWPKRAFAADIFLNELPYETVNTPATWSTLLIPKIRDENDAPILAAAILENVDVLVTGDKDFLVLDLPKPKIMTMAEFVEVFSS